MEKPFLLILIFFQVSKIVNSFNCGIVQIEMDEILVLTKQYQIIQSDAHDVTKIPDDDYSLAQLEMRIPYQSEELIISSLILEILPPKLFGKHFCVLHRQQAHFISCLNISQQFASSKLNKQTLNQLLKIQIKIDTINGEMCEEIVQEQNEILIFCITINELRIYSVNFESIKNLIIYPINELQQQNCKRKYFKRNGAQYLIIYYQCIQWEILNFQRNQISLVFNSEIAYNQFGKRIDYLENFHGCQASKNYKEYCYLVSNTGYYNYFIQSNNLMSQNYFIPVQDLKDILINEVCTVILLINQEESTNKVNIIQNNNIIKSISNQFKSYLFKNLLFVLSQDKLEIISNQVLKKTFQIAYSELHFHNLHNLFCQVDNINNEILIYKHLGNQKIIKPSKKFLFFIGQTFNIQYIICSQIEILSFSSISQINFSKFNNICQISDKILINKETQMLPIEYQFKINNDSSSNINSINDQSSFKLQCKVINYKNLIEGKLIILNYNSFDNIILLKDGNLIFFLNCLNGQKYKFSIHQKEVFFYQENILLLNESNKKQITLIQYQNNKINQTTIQLKEQIIKIVQFQQFCLLFLEANARNLLIDIKLQKIEEFSETLNTFLNQAELLINQQENIKEQVFFYFSGSINFFQYFEHLIVMKQEQYIYIKLENAVIIQIQEIIFDVYQLLALNQIENVIQIYYLNIEELILVYEYTDSNAKILRPFKYSINQNYLIIAANSQENQLLLIFTIFKKKNLKLIKTIEISSLKFLLENHYLYYFDKSSNFIVYNIQYFEVTLKNLNPQQIDALNIQQFSFQIFSLDSNESNITISFDLMKVNQCYQLFPIQNETQLQLKNNNYLRIKLDQLFLGQIDNLTLLQNNNTYLNGPFLLQEKITNYEQNYNIKIRTIFLQQTNNESQQYSNAKVYVFHLESGIQVITNHEQMKNYFYKVNEIFLDMICENDKFLFALLLTYQKELSIRRFSIKDNYLILEEQFVIQQEFKLTGEYQVYKIGQLIILNQNPNPYLFRITDKAFEIFANDYQQFQEILLIKNTNYLYIAIENIYMQVEYLIIQIFALKDNQIKALLHREINQDVIITELKKQVLIEDTTENNILKLIELLDAYQFENKINLVIMIKLINFQIISSFTFNLNDENIIFRVNKIIRTSINQEILQTHYYDSNILILKSTQNQTYTYDLRQQRLLCDFVNFNSQINFQLYPLNIQIQFQFIIQFLLESQQNVIFSIYYTLFILLFLN